MIPVILNIILVKSPGQGTATSQLKLDQLASQVYTRVTKYQLPYIHSQTSQLYFQFYLASYIYSQRIIYSCIYPIQLLATTNLGNLRSSCQHSLLCCMMQACTTTATSSNNLCFANLSIFQFLTFYYKPPLLLLVSCTAPDSL